MPRTRARWTVAAGLLLALAGAAPATAQQTGNFCVRDFQPGAVCTANDVRIQALNLINIIEDCPAGDPTSALANFRVFVSSVGSPDRYDIGLFIALDGGSARDGDACYHDFLEPPLIPNPVYGDANGDGIPDLVGGPWWDADADLCGDILSNSQLLKAAFSMRVACVDTNGNGTVDASVCTSWDNNAVTNCASLPDAFPGTNAKCGCARVETGIPFVVGSPSPPPSPSPSPPASPSPSPPSSPSPFPSFPPGPTPPPTPPPVPALPPGALLGLAAALAAAGSLLLLRR